MYSGQSYEVSVLKVNHSKYTLGCILEHAKCEQSALTGIICCK